MASVFVIFIFIVGCIAVVAAIIKLNKLAFAISAGQLTAKEGKRKVFIVLLLLIASLIGMMFLIAATYFLESVITGKPFQIIY